MVDQVGPFHDLFEAGTLIARYLARRVVGALVVHTHGLKVELQTPFSSPNASTPKTRKFFRKGGSVASAISASRGRPAITIVRKTQRPL